MNSPKATRTWAQRAEAASLSGQGHDLAAARQRFAALTPAARFALAREIALSRAPELTLAYRNLVMVAAGYKLKQDRAGRQRRTSQPCVVFVVKAKWNAGDAGEAGGPRADDPQHLPAELLAFATDATGRRVLCAVPTDVQPATGYSGAQAHAARDVAVGGEFGSLTCAVELRQGNKRSRYLLSAQHVFSPAPQLDPPALAVDQPLLALAADGSTGAELGRSANIGGRLCREPAMSFDAQLARPSAGAQAALQAMLGDLMLNAQQPFVAAFEDFAALVDQWLEVLVPDNSPNTPSPRAAVLARFSGFMPPAFSIDYEVRKAGGGTVRAPVHHFELLRLQLKGASTLAGDSGAPVVCWRDDGSATLIGMHLGGELGLSYVLPAWQLFDADSYWQIPAGATLRPLSSG